MSGQLGGGRQCGGGEAYSSPLHRFSLFSPPLLSHSTFSASFPVTQRSLRQGRRVVLRSCYTDRSASVFVFCCFSCWCRASVATMYSTSHCTCEVHDPGTTTVCWHQMASLIQTHVPLFIPLHTCTCCCLPRFTE
ncbi:hypothetical protein E2C01_009906 [Portunus trituberculatus]|uniref:SWIM-type domain-containing protein n=1 Tax=Portunus trituberculatus TaxID=210409 RepID=A0A5B7D6Y5_PORTR|nr:hypothetical protein [Portunus trituberculatus]